MALCEPSPEADRIAKVVVESSFEVRRELGIGLSEKAYVRSLAARIRGHGVAVQLEVPLPLVVDGETVLGGRADMVVGGLVLVEAKAAGVRNPRHRAQALTYLRMSRCEIALVIDFGAQPLRTGIQRLVLSAR